MLLKPLNIPEPPGWLQGEALLKWTELWSVLERTQIKPEMHSDMVAMYCQAYGDFLKAVLMLKDKGEHVVINGKAQPNPYVEVKDSAFKQMSELGKALGLEPGKPLIPLRPFSDYTDGEPDDGEADEEYGEEGQGC
jgi:P27 family predicted phage terminase small subunit